MFVCILTPLKACRIFKDENSVFLLERWGVYYNQNISLTTVLNGHLLTLTHRYGYQLPIVFPDLCRSQIYRPSFWCLRTSASKTIALFLDSAWIPTNPHKTLLATQSCTSQPSNTLQGRLYLVMTCRLLPKNSSLL